MPRVLIMLVGLCFYLEVEAFPCFLTLVKDSCWTNYDLVVMVTDPTTEKVLTTVTVPQGTSWGRQQFTCQPGETLALSASFSPLFWETDKGKTYAAQHSWSLPTTITKGDTAWNITVCYPKEFSEVPFPPNASGDCKCDTDHIPPVKPQ